MKGMPAFEHSYQQLPHSLFVRQAPIPVANPTEKVFNHALAKELGLKETSPDVYAGNRLLPGMRPISQAYAGHQFGHFTMLGDGRAVLLGEWLCPGERRVDIQLKGSGRTPFSRGGDGRAALEPMLREYLISEAMHALGIPSTRSLCVISTGESVHREQALPGAILTRIAASHLRVGTFEFAAHRTEDREALPALTRYSLHRHFPEATESDQPGKDLLERVMQNQADLIAQWMRVGFVHGVMNTDNMAISGETIDYGPCAFMDRYNPDTVFSSIDTQGRYAFGNQPHVGQWNLACLAGALLPILHPDKKIAAEIAKDCVERFPGLFLASWQREMNAKIGLHTVQTGDRELIQKLLEWMQQTRSDYTLGFQDLHPEETPQDPGLAKWHEQWTARLRLEGRDSSHVLQRMHQANPMVIPRNHQVEAALNAAGEGDLKPFLKLQQALATPYRRSESSPEFEKPPPPCTAPYRTFCGT